MKTLLILVTLAAIAVAGLMVGQRLQQRRALAEAAAERAHLEAARAAAQAKAEAAAPASEDADDDDDDEAAYRDVMAKRALTDNCLVCHEEGMFTGQRLTAAQWKSEIDKMLGWGAVLPEADRRPVEEYLTRHFGEATPVPPPGRAHLADVPTHEIPGDPAEGSAGADLASGGKLYLVVCASCHGPAALGTELGPALVDRAVLTHGEDYHKVVREGRRKMPAMNSLLTADQQRDILGWLRGLDRDAAGEVASK
ncbi:c-type cytochrome [Paludisphaera soli]|uniref:c-type cytochrome n=1 Tax=Paludisphaera soli TaxID=2712865 RepID=UPI0013EB189F|nr:c-type cytochrome [Paludisphaera soli]